MHFLLDREGLVTFSSADLINVLSAGSKFHCLGPQNPLQFSFLPLMTVLFFKTLLICFATLNFNDAAESLMSSACLISFIYN